MMKQTYYERHKEARKAYQKMYYGAMKGHIARQRELLMHLDPDKVAKTKVYQDEYYWKNRERILAKRRETYALNRLKRE